LTANQQFARCAFLGRIHNVKKGFIALAVFVGLLFAASGATAQTIV